MSFGTVFEFLKSVKHMGLTEKWLTPTLSVLLYRHGDNYLSFKADEQDTCVHAAVRYALITGTIIFISLFKTGGMLQESTNFDSLCLSFYQTSADIFVSLFHAQTENKLKKKLFYVVILR